MKTSEQIDKIAVALDAAHKELGPATAGGFNDFQRYRYATLADYKEAYGPVLQKHGLFIASSVSQATPLESRISAKGKTQQAILVFMDVRLIHKSGQWIEIQATGEAQDGEDKATYQAITGARKYGVAALLDMTTTDDPEAPANPAKGAKAGESGRKTANEKLGGKDDAPDPRLLNTTSARRVIMAACRKRGVPAPRIGDLVTEWCIGQGVDSFDRLSVNQRAELLAHVEGEGFNDG
jgi:hypothetical protein